jgi:hypothetical protein
VDGCYDEIARNIKPHLKRILRSKQWSKCERRILKSWQG